MRRPLSKSNPKTQHDSTHPEPQNCEQKEHVPSITKATATENLQIEIKLKLRLGIGKLIWPRNDSSLQTVS
jgi:hypothetical protein